MIITLIGSGILGVVVGVVGSQRFVYHPKFDTDGTQVQYAFSKRIDSSPKALLKGIIDETQSQLDIAIYTFTDDDITQKIIKAKKRGVNVRLITDGSQLEHENQRIAMDKLSQVNIPVIVSRIQAPGVMHLKLSISDEKVVTTGSFNYSYPASKQNDEVLAVLRNPSIAKDWSNHYEQLWNDRIRFEPYVSRMRYLYA